MVATATVLPREVNLSQKKPFVYEIAVSSNDNQKNLNISKVYSEKKFAFKMSFNWDNMLMSLVLQGEKE